MLFRATHTAIAAAIVAVSLPSFAQTKTAAPARRSSAHGTVAARAAHGIPPVRTPMHIQYVMRYQEITIGKGELAKPGDFYKVHYTGWLASSGLKFDSSYDRGTPIEFLQGSKRVITGWDQGFEGMHVGGKRRLFIPYQLAYGEKGRGPIPPKAELIFDVELLDQRDPNAPSVEMQPAPQQQPQQEQPKASAPQ